jgi:tRNA1(Val) A37 N6-methylase TrmN6
MNPNIVLYAETVVDITKNAKTYNWALKVFNEVHETRECRFSMWIYNDR